MNSRLQAHSLTAVALAASLFLAACGGGSAEPPPVPGTPADTTAPTVTITDSVADATARGDVTFAFAFNEDVGISFTADDITVTGGTKGAFTRLSGTGATLVVTPTPNAAGSIEISIAAAGFADAAGNASGAAVTAQQAYNTVAAAVSGNTGTCAAPCIDFAAASVGVEGFEGLGAAAVVNDPADAANKVLRLMKVPAGQPWAGATVYTDAATKTIGAIGLDSSKVITLRVYSPAVGKKIRLKVEDGADPTVSMEKDVLTTVAGTWETLSFDFTTPDAGTYNPAKTYNKASIFPDFLVAATADDSYYFDELKVPAAAGGGGGATTATVDMAGASVALEGFEGLGSAAIVDDPTNAANKVARLVKVPAGQPWAGATLYTVAADKSIAPIGFATSKLLTLRVYSPAPGKKIRVKVEDAADPTVSMEVDALTTGTNAWETLSFDFTTPTAGTYNAAKTYSKVSIFPDFLVAAAADTTYYFDDLVYPVGTASGGGGGGGSGNLTNGVYASNYSEAPTPWRSVEGGDAGRYIDTAVTTQDWWSGLAAGDATPSFYFGFGINTAARPWGFGAFVKAPGNGTALVSGYTNLRLSVWGNDQMMTLRPTLTVILKGPAVGGCTSELKGNLTVTGIGVQTYTLPLAGFTLQTACAYANAAAALAAGVNEIHIQALGTALQYSAGGDAAGFFPNGFNIGPINFN